jgi:Leucine-rich repeat (LRR) protein
MKHGAHENVLQALWEDFALRPYLGEVNRRHGFVETVALPNMRDLSPIRIESLFVQPHLSSTFVSSIGSNDAWPDGESLFQALESSSCIVLLGDPGSGKTTLASWLAWRLSAGLNAPLPDVLNGRLPIPCVLREMKPSVFSPDVSVAQLAELVAERLLGQKMDSRMRSSVAQRIEKKQYVLILDGLDEIPASHRITVANWMRQAKDDGACALATARIVGYDDFRIDQQVVSHREALNPRAATPDNEDIIAKPTPKSTEAIDSRWAELRYLMPFDQERIAAFVNNWYAQRSAGMQEALEKSSDLLNALNNSEQMRVLARTPNLLSLMAIVHRERAHLPDGKALLYKEISNAYINTIDQHRKILTDDALARFTWEVRESWLAYVGFRMQIERDTELSGDVDSGVLISEQKVLEWLIQAMTQSEVSRPELRAREFLAWVARRSGLLLPRGEGQFAFVHLSFQEYFCARYLAIRVMSPAFIKGKLSADALVTRQKLQEWSERSLWRESFIYLFELISGERDADWVQDLAENVFGSADKSDYFSVDRARLAGLLICDRHIHLNSTWRAKLAYRTSLVAFNEWRYPRDGHAVLSSFLKTNHGVLLATSPEQLGPRGDGLLVTHPNSIDAHDPADIFVLIAAGRDISDLKILRGMNEIRLLDLDRTSIKNISALSRMRNLNRLEVIDSPIKNIAPLAGLQHLRELSLRSTAVENIQPLADLPRLAILDLGLTKVRNISVLQQMRKLRYLSLAHTLIENLEPVRKLSALEALVLDYAGISDLEPLAGLRELFMLSLTGTKVIDLTPLAGLHRLSTLDLDETPISDLSPLVHLPNLRMISLKNTNVDDISPLAHIKSLTNIYLDGTPVADVRPLAKLRHLSQLSLHGAKVTDISALRKKKALRIDGVSS